MIKVTFIPLEKDFLSPVNRPLELFSSARGPSGEPLCAIEVASVPGQPVTYRMGEERRTSVELSEISHTDIVFVVSGVPDDQSHLHKVVVPWLRKMYEQGASLCGVGTGTLALAATDLLDLRQATTHRDYVEEFQTQFPLVDLRPEQACTEDARIFTTCRNSKCPELVLLLMLRYFGKEVAIAAAHQMGLPLMARRLETEVADTFSDHKDAAIRQVENFLRDNPEQPHRMEELAESMGLSVRQFSRRFKAATGVTPLTYLRRLRVKKAVSYLREEKKHLVEEVSVLVGYEDPGHFRRIFKEEMGMSPSDYRRSLALAG